jgi:hypothetical protein
MVIAIVIKYRFGCRRIHAVFWRRLTLWRKNLPQWCCLVRWRRKWRRRWTVWCTGNGHFYLEVVGVAVSWELGA